MAVFYQVGCLKNYFLVGRCYCAVCLKNGGSTEANVTDSEQLEEGLADKCVVFRFSSNSETFNSFPSWVLPRI